LFYDLLRTQLILRGVIAEDEWEEIKEQINFRFQKDNFFSELKNTEILMNRVQTALAIEPLLGKYFSVENVAKNIFKFSNEEVEKMEEQMEQEYADHPWWYQTQQMYDQQQQMGMQQAFGTMPAGQGDQQQNQPQQ
jgi:hypothetical protein